MILSMFLQKKEVMSKEKDFFVGYLKLPKRHIKFLKIFLPILFLAIILLSFVLVNYQVRPNKSKGWDPTGKTAINIKARLLTKPYALARFKYKSKIYTAILTSMTKSGVTKRLKGLHNKWVNLKGVMTRYNGRFVFSILDSKNAIYVLKSKADIAKIFFKKNWGFTELKGEIIDPKCYVSAMKPGEGKTHKACATLCIKGGIPPVLLVKNFLFAERFYLLLDSNGNAVLDSIIKFVGDQVTAKGSVEQWGDLWFFKLKNKSIKKINL